jgi:hypothetical protein
MFVKVKLYVFWIFISFLFLSEAIAQHFNYQQTEDYYPIIIESITLDGQAIEDGDEVGVFFINDNSELVCGGATVWPIKGFEAWSDDTQTSEKDGFVSVEELYFVLWDASEQTEIGPPDNVTYLSGDGNWGTGQFTQISLMEFIEDYLTVDPSNREVGSLSGQTTFSVSSNISWTVSEGEHWLSVTPASGSGDGILTVDYDENTSTSKRVGTISVSGGGITREVTVTQIGAQPFITVIPESYYVGYESGDTTLIIESNTEWSILLDESWVTITPTAGSGNDTLSIHFEQNLDLDPRTEIINISGDGISIDVEFNQDYITDIATNMNELPKEYGLEQSYPNPFNPATTISFSLPKESNIILEIYDLSGQKVQTLVNTRMNAGYHNVLWNAGHLSSGIYLYRIRTDSFQDIKKMILAK